MKDYDLTIIGAGISGLSLSHFAADAGLKTLVLEKSTGSGGAIHSHHGSKDPAFWIEMGAHTCYNSYGNLISIIENLHLQSQLSQRERHPFRLLDDGHLLSIPSQLHYLDLLFCLPRILWSEKAGESVKSYYAKIMGQRNYQPLFAKMFAAVSCQTADDIPADFLFKKRPRRKDFPKSFCFKQGMSTLTDALAADSRISLKTATGIHSINHVENLFQLIDDKGTAYQTKNLALATPVDMAATLLGDSFPAIARQLAALKTTRIETMSVIVRNDLCTLPLCTGVVPLNDDFYSIVSRDTLTDAGQRGFSFHFKADTLTDAEKIARVCALLGVSHEDITDIAQRVNILPAPRAQHQQTIQGIDHLLAGQSIYLTGNYFSGMALEDCASRSRREMDRLLRQRSE